MYTGRAGSAFQCQQMYDSRNKNINTTNVDTVYLIAKVLGYTIQDLIEKYILNLREVFLFVAFRLIYTTISNPQKLQRQHRSLRHRDGPYSLYRRVKNWYTCFLIIRRLPNVATPPSVMPNRVFCSKPKSNHLSVYFWARTSSIMGHRSSNPDGCRK